MTRLGIYCPGNGTGGPWRCVHSILAGLDPAEFDVTVFCDLPGVYEPQPWVRVVRLGDPAAPPGVAPPASAPTGRPGRGRWLPPVVRQWAGFAHNTRRLARVFRAHPVDLLHTQCTGYEESPVAARLAGVSHVLGTFHVNSTIDLHGVRSGPSYRVLEQVSNRCLDAAVAVSHATRRDWIGRTHIPAGRVVAVHNGIDPDHFRRRQSRDDARRRFGIPTDALVVGGLGRLDEVKGFPDLLHAAARLRPEFPGLVVVIAGDGPHRAALQAVADRLGLGGNVRLLGFQADVQAVLDILDVFALPSLCEALPYALLEAMATELPAVGSTVGGVPEVIDHGVTGFLVPPRDPAALAAALRTFLKDADLRARMGKAGRARVVETFHERDMVRQTIDLYRKAGR